MVTGSADFLSLVHQLAEVTQTDSARYSSFKTGGHTFAFHWPATGTVGLKQPLAEQLALVAERPDVFEPQFTSGQFGWVVVQLSRIDRQELAELTFEAWRMTASAALVEASGDRLPH